MTRASRSPSRGVPVHAALGQGGRPGHRSPGYPGPRAHRREGHLADHRRESTTPFAALRVLVPRSARGLTGATRCADRVCSSLFPRPGEAGKNRTRPARRPAHCAAIRYRPWSRPTPVPLVWSPGVSVLCLSRGVGEHSTPSTERSGGEGCGAIPAAQGPGGMDAAHAASEAMQPWPPQTRRDRSHVHRCRQPDNHRWLSLAFWMHGAQDRPVCIQKAVRAAGCRAGVPACRRTAPLRVAASAPTRGLGSLQETRPLPKTGGRRATVGARLSRKHPEPGTLLAPNPHPGASCAAAGAATTGIPALLTEGPPGLVAQQQARSSRPAAARAGGTGLSIADAAIRCRARPNG